MGFLAGPPTLTNSDEWPVKRHQQHQDYRFDHGQPESDFKQIPGFEISIRVSNDHRSRLVDKNLPTCSKGPDHAELEGIETMRLREIHEQGHGSSEHRDFAGKEEVINKPGPIQNDRRDEDIRQQRFHPGKHDVGEETERLGLIQDLPHADGSSNKEYRQYIDPFQIVDGEHSQTRQNGAEADA